MTLQQGSIVKKGNQTLFTFLATQTIHDIITRIRRQPATPAVVTLQQGNILKKNTEIQTLFTENVTKC